MSTSNPRFPRFVYGLILNVIVEFLSATAHALQKVIVAMRLGSPAAFARGE